MPDPRASVAAPPTRVAPLDRDGPTRLPVSPPPVSNLPAPVREPALPDPSRPPAPLARRLPEHKGKVARIGGALAGLSEDLKAWIELRIQLVQTEIQEQIDYRVAEAKRYAAAGLLAALGAFFLLVTLALLFGWVLFLLGLGLLLAVFLGFLLLTLLLFLVAFVAYRRLAPAPPPSARPDPPA